MISRDSLKKSSPATPAANAKTKKKSNLDAKTLLIGGALAAGLGLYVSVYQNTEEPVTTDTKETLTKLNVPVGMQGVEDKFFSAEEYKKFYLERNCQANNCQELNLNNDKGEGIYSENFQSVVFIRPSIHYQEAPFNKMADRADKDDLMALHIFLKSPLFTRFLNKEMAQVHVVLINDELQNTKVYRLHTKFFTTGDANKIRLFMSLKKALSSSAEMTFWKRAQAVIKSQDLK